MKGIAMSMFRVATCGATLVVLAGCSRPATDARAAAADNLATVRYIVYDIDVTGSYALVGQALEQAASEVTRSARAGDVWYFRVINKESYSDRAAIMTLRCPARTYERINPFDKRAKARSRARLRSFAELKASAAAQIRAYKTAGVKGTDIYGALAKAGDLLSGAAEGAEKILMISSDFGDTERRAANINLQGVRVFVAAFQSGGDPKKAQTIRRTWTQKLTKYGAAAVTFADASEGTGFSPLGN